MRGKLNGWPWRISQTWGRRGEEAGDGIGEFGSRICFCLQPALVRLVLRSSRQTWILRRRSRRRLRINLCKPGGQSTQFGTEEQARIRNGRRA